MLHILVLDTIIFRCLLSRNSFISCSSLIQRFEIFVVVIRCRKTVGAPMRATAPALISFSGPSPHPIKRGRVHSFTEFSGGERRKNSGGVGYEGLALRMFYSLVLALSSPASVSLRFLHRKI